jgi:hypothetical protein
MTTTTTSTAVEQASTIDRLARLYRPLRFTAIAMTAVTIAAGVLAAAVLPDPMVVGWTFAADGSLLARHTLDPVLGASLFSVLAVGSLGPAAAISALTGCRAAGAAAYGLSSLFVGLFGCSQLLLFWLNLG